MSPYNFPYTSTYNAITSTYGSMVYNAIAASGGTAVQAHVAGLYIDNLHIDNIPDDLAVINTIPENTETAVLCTANIALQICAFNDPLTAVTKAWVKIGDAPRELAYDQAGTGFQTGFDGPDSSYDVKQSVGSSVDDEGWLVIDPTTDFPSDTKIMVDVQAQAGAEILNLSYYFNTAFTEAPVVAEILWINPRRARLKFREAMRTNNLDGGTLYMASITGGMEYVAPNMLLTTGKVPKVEWIGYWIGVTGSAYPQNNRYLRVTAVDSANNLIVIDNENLPLKDDNGIDKDSDGNTLRTRVLRGVITSFKIEGDLDSESEVACSYEPIIINVRAAEQIEMPTDGDPDKYAIVDLHDDISISRKYKWHTIKAISEYEIAADLTSIHSFTSPSFNTPVDRIKIWDFIPDLDKEEDNAHQNHLNKMAVVLQDMLNVLWHRCDTLQYLYDPDRATDAWIPYLLYTLGNPFRLPLNVLHQRRLCSVLSAIYKQVGTAKIIEETLTFFLDGNFTVSTFQSRDWWELGTSALNSTAILGPSTKRAKNCYEIISDRVLTDEERDAARHIAETLDPLYMHLVRIIEP